MKRPKLIITGSLLGWFLLASCSSSITVGGAGDVEVGDSADSDPARDFRIVTLLPRDAIPAIDNPVFLAGEEADREYEDEELVLGVSINGESRAYSVGTLSNHEIVNDSVGGQKIAVTW